MRVAFRDAVGGRILASSHIIKWAQYSSELIYLSLSIDISFVRLFGRTYGNNL